MATDLDTETYIKQNGKSTPNVERLQMMITELQSNLSTEKRQNNALKQEMETYATTNEALSVQLASAETKINVLRDESRIYRDQIQDHEEWKQSAIETVNELRMRANTRMAMDTINQLTKDTETNELDDHDSNSVTSSSNEIIADDLQSQIDKLKRELMVKNDKIRILSESVHSMENLKHRNEELNHQIVQIQSGMANKESEIRKMAIENFRLYDTNSRLCRERDTLIVKLQNDNASNPENVNNGTVPAHSRMRTIVSSDTVDGLRRTFEDDLTIHDEVDYSVDLDQQEAIRMHFSPQNRSRTASRRASTVYSKSRNDSTCSVLSNLGGEVLIFRERSGSIEVRDDLMDCIEGDEGSPSALSGAEDVIDTHYSHSYDDDQDDHGPDGNVTSVTEKEEIFFPNDRPSVECRMEIEDEKGKEIEAQHWTKGGKYFSDIDWSSDEEVEYSTITGSKKYDRETTTSTGTNGKNAECTCVGVETLDEEQMDIERNRVDCSGQSTILQRVISSILPSKIGYQGA